MACVMGMIVSLRTARAEKLIENYRNKVKSRMETKDALMVAFDLEEIDAELLLEEIDCSKP
jgi:hypothetical protein